MTRTREVFNVDEVIHRWANMAREANAIGRTSSHSVSFAGGELRSYSRIIASIQTSPMDCTTLACFFDIWTERASAWTNASKRHLDRARRAVHPMQSFDVAVMPLLRMSDEIIPRMEEIHRRNLGSYAERIALAEKKVKHARSNKEWRVTALADLQEQANRYCRFFGLADAYDADVLAELRATYERERTERRERQEREQLEYEAKLRVSLADRVKAWRNGDDVPVYDYPDVMLRASFGTAHYGDVETSKGARVPIQDAKRLYDAIVAREAKVSDRVGVYTVRDVQDDAIDIGCHHITRAEIERFAQAQYWTDADEDVPQSVADWNALPFDARK